MYQSYNVQSTKFKWMSEKTIEHKQWKKFARVKDEPYSDTFSLVGRNLNKSKCDHRIYGDGSGVLIEHDRNKKFGNFLMTDHGVFSSIGKEGKTQPKILASFVLPYHGNSKSKNQKNTRELLLKTLRLMDCDK